MKLRGDDHPPRDFVPPRIGTPRDPDSQTYGPQISDVAAKRLGTPLMPWQAYTNDVAYEVDAATGLLKYDLVVLTVMRQSGKTVWVRTSTFWRLTRGPKVFGQRQVSMYTAQKRATARERLEKDFVGALRSDFVVDTGSFIEITNPKARPGKSTREWKASMNNGQENVQFGRNNYLKIDAPTRAAGHSDTLDEATLDEMWALQNDDVEQGVDPAMQTRDNSQLRLVSAAGDHKSFFMWPKIREGRRMVAAGEQSSVCYLEWSLPPEASVDDVDAWWEYMPALNRTIRESRVQRSLEKAKNSPDEDALDMFRRGTCNQWPRIPILIGEDAVKIISADAWKSGEVVDTTPIIGRVGVGVAVSPNGAAAGIAVAGRNAYGKLQIELAYYEPSTFWFESRLRGVIERNNPIGVGYGDGAVRALSPDIRRAAAVTNTPIVPMTGAEWSAACDGIVIAFDENRANHLDQAHLNRSLDGARKKFSGTSWKFDWLTSEELVPLAAVTAAARVFEMEPPEPQEGAPNLW